METLFYCVLAFIAVLFALRVIGENPIPLICTILLVVFWGVNNFIYMAGDVSYYIFTDSAFTVAALILWFIFRQTWLFLLMLSYLFDVILDTRLLGQPTASIYVFVAWSENIIYVLQLCIASYLGWKPIVVRGE